MRGKIVAIIGALLLLVLLVQQNLELEEFNPHSAITEEEKVGGIWLQVELLNWGSNESISWDRDGSEIDVYFKICVEFEGYEPECIDSRVWSNASSIESQWSAVHFIDNELAGFNLTMECIDFDAYKDDETQKCDMSSSPGRSAIWFAFSPSNESNMRNLSTGIHTQTTTNTDEYNAWTHWGISALTLKDDDENGVPNLWEHCHSSPVFFNGAFFDVAMSDWSQIVFENCPPSSSLDSDMDGFSDLIEVQCYSDFEDYNNTPSDLDDDSICDAIDFDDDNDSVPDIIDSCPNTQIEFFHKTELDLDEDGCYSIYADADLDGDGIGNNQDACKTIASKESSIGVGEGCPGPEQFHVGYLIAGILILWISARHYNRLSNPMSLAIANRSNPSHYYTSRHTAEILIDEVSKIDKMSTSSIIKLAKQFGIDETGERRKKEIISKAINIAVQSKRVNKVKLRRDIMAFICFFLVISWVGAAVGALFLDETDEEIILENSIFHPTHWDTSDYQQYLETGISPSNNGMASSEPEEFSFGSNWTTHKVLFESYITTDCTKREFGGYTIQSDKLYLGKSVTDNCEFSVTMPLNAGGKITILTDGGILDGWFFTDPSIDVLADGESIASGSTDESRIVQGRTSAIFVKSGYHTLEIDAHLFSDDDQFHIVGIEVTGLNRGLLIDETDVYSLNAEIMNGENFSRQLENLNESMVWLKIITLCLGFSRYVYTSKNGAKDKSSPNNLVILNQQLLWVNAKIAKLPPKIPRSKITVKVSRLNVHELIFLAGEVGINIWNQKHAPSGVPTTREKLLRSKKYELIDWLYTTEKLQRTQNKAAQEFGETLNSGTKNELANLLYPMIQRIGLENQVTDELVKHKDPIHMLSWIRSQPWNDGNNKKLKLPTGESISHTFPLKCGDNNLNDNEAVMHVIQTAYKATKGVKKQQVEEIFQHPLVLLGTNCTMSGCKAKFQIRTIPIGTIKISAK